MDYQIKLFMNKIIFDKLQIRIAVNGHLLKVLKQRIVIIQGAALSPFIIVLDFVMKNVTRESGILTLINPNNKLSDLEYADATILFVVNQC
jgi:hypothetical protein